MTGPKGWKRVDKERRRAWAVGPHQIRAAASPRMSLKQLAGETEPALTSGNFHDLESLLEQLGSPPVFELGKPLPHQRFIPGSRVGDCPAAHNRALLGEETD